MKLRSAEAQYQNNQRADNGLPEEHPGRGSKEGGLTPGSKINKKLAWTHNTTLMLSSGRGRVTSFSAFNWIMQIFYNSVVASITSHTHNLKILDQKPVKKKVIKVINFSFIKLI